MQNFSPCIFPLIPRVLKRHVMVLRHITKTSPCLVGISNLSVAQKRIFLKFSSLPMFSSFSPHILSPIPLSNHATPRKCFTNTRLDSQSVPSPSSCPTTLIIYSLPASSPQHISSLPPKPPHLLSLTPTTVPITKINDRREEERIHQKGKSTCDLVTGTPPSPSAAIIIH